MIENPNVICNECGFCKQNKILKQQLAIAVEALKKYADKDRWTDVDTPFGYYEKAHYWKEKNPQADSIYGYDGFE